MNNTTVALVILATGLLAGCRSPSSPSAPPPAGTVELTTNRPEGATLVVNSCVDEEGARFTCTRDLQLIFSVVLNRNVERARVWTEFYTSGRILCGSAGTAIVRVTAGTPVTLTTSSISLALQGSLTPPECGLPLQTTRMVAHLHEDPTMAPHGDLLTQEFSRVYRFIGP